LKEYINYTNNNDIVNKIENSKVLQKIDEENKKLKNSNKE
jgi:hypothetical protein